MAVIECQRAAVLLCLVCFGWVSGNPAGPRFKATQGEVWPRPMNLTYGQQSFYIAPDSLTFKVSRYSCNILSEAVKRYGDILNRLSRNTNPFTDRFNGGNSEDGETIKEVVLNLKNPCENMPHADMDESYLITVKGPGSETGAVMITSSSIWGMLKGLETFAQLCYYNGTVNQLVIKEVQVKDQPRFSHRGLMLDTARHYLPVKVIKLMLDAMEANKLNILHWHMVDDESFPYKSEVFPALSGKGAYNSDTMIYGNKDVLSIIKYAKLRGIRVIPEFDSPGHTQSWGLGQKGLLTPCYNKEQPNGLFGPVDPSNPQNYDFIRSLFDEVSKLFPDADLHLGGDEVQFDCWESNPNLSDFMKKMGFTTYNQLEDYYIRNLLNITESLNKNQIVWQEVYQNNKQLSRNVTVHLWTGNQESLLSEVTRSGYKTILSTCWYLDHFEQTLYAGGGDWKKFYMCDPLNFPGKDEDKVNLIGGEACMWGEYVDQTNIVPRVWPRASAAAERLWSWEYDEVKAAYRLEEHVCRMRARGIRAQPPNGPGACLP